MPNFYRRDFSLGWQPDNDAENAAPGSLLRATNVVLDETGALALRRGSSKLDDSLTGGNVHTVNSFYLNGTLYRFAGVGSKLYSNGTDSGLTFGGTGDYAMGSDAYQAFVARGSTRKKFDGTAWRNWNIAAPEFAPAVSAANATTVTVATFASGETPAFTVTEGTSAFVTGADGTGSGALQLTVDSAGQASAYKTLSADTNYMDIAGTIGGDTDIFDMYCALSDWSKVDSVTVMFGLNTGSDPFKDDYYYFDWQIRDKKDVDLRHTAAAASGVLKQIAESVVQAIDPVSMTQVKTPAEIQREKVKRQGYGTPTSRFRRDAAQASPAWFHASTTRAQFKRVGVTGGRDWTTVRGFKVIAKTVAKGTYTVTFDTAQWYGGGSRALTGTYRCLVVAARDTGNYVELSPASPLSPEIALNQNGLNVTISAATIASLDPQVNQLWVYLFSNSLGGWYRFAVVGATATYGQSMDEFDPSGDASIDAADRTRFTQWGLTIPGFSGSGTIAAIIRKSEDEALRENIPLVPYLTPPPNDIKAIVSPYFTRTLAVTEEGWLYISAQNSPSHFNGLHIQDLRRYGDPKWMVRTNGGVYVGLTKDVVRLAGTFDEDADGNIDAWAEPLGSSNPPVDEAVYTDGNAIVYRAADGLMTLQGVTTTPVTQTGISLLWRGVARHGVEPLNITTGRFRMAVDNHVLYMLAPEGVSTSGTSAIWRYDTLRDRWYRTFYAASFHSIHRDPDGRLIAGDSAGNVWLLEDGSDDDGTPITIDILTPYDDDGQPMRRKTAHDLVFGGGTGGSYITMIPVTDGIQQTTAYSVSTSSGIEHRQNIYGLTDFTKLGWLISGSPTEFRLRHLNVGYRLHPQQRMALDTGYITPPGNGDLAWITEAEISVRTPVNLELVPYFDDAAQDTLTITATPNVYTTYRVPFKRGQNKGRRPRLLLRTTNGAAEGNVGFELDWMRIRLKGTGNETEKVLQVYGGGAE